MLLADIQSSRSCQRYIRYNCEVTTWKPGKSNLRKIHKRCQYYSLRLLGCMLANSISVFALCLPVSTFGQTHLEITADYLMVSDCHQISMADKSSLLVRSLRNQNSFCMSMTDSILLFDSFTTDVRQNKSLRGVRSLEKRILNSQGYDYSASNQAE